MGERYKFISSKDPFEGLDEYRKSKRISVKEESTKYPIQLSLFNGSIEHLVNGKKDEGYGLRTSEGRLFELIDHSIYGGKIKSRYHKNGKSNKDFVSTEPDITNENKGVLREVKAVAPGNSLKLRDTQIAKYVLFQTRNYFKNPPKIFFDIYRHGVKGMQEKYKGGNIEGLVKDLSSTIRFSITLPFSVIFESYIQDNDANYRYDGPNFDSLTGLNTSTLNKFIADPEEALRKFGLDPNDFEIKKRKFPKNSRINGNLINSFPMLFIWDKNYDRFIEHVEEKINSDKTLSYRFHQHTKGLIGEKPKLDLEGIPDWIHPIEEETPF